MRTASSPSTGSSTASGATRRRPRRSPRSRTTSAASGVSSAIGSSGGRRGTCCASPTASATSTVFSVWSMTRRGAEPAVAAERLAEALALWRGPPLADLAGEPAAGAAAHLEDLRLAALEERIEADLALGRHAAVVPELEELVAREPYRERLRGQLIVALYRSGRQADALEAYARARRAFVDELGTEPSRPLQELQRAVLNRDPALEAPAGVEPPPVRPPRAEERRTVTCSPPTSRPTICLTIRKRVARCCANEASWQRSCSRPTARQCRVSEAAGCSACSAFPLRATRTCCKPRAQPSRCVRARASDSPPVRW